MEKENTVKEKALAFAVRVVNLYRYLIAPHNEFVVSKQILRSGTSVGALIWRARRAESRADFIHRMTTALKEACETEYRLLLLHETDFLTEEQFGSLQGDLPELLELLTSIIKNAGADSGEG